METASGDRRRLGLTDLRGETAVLELYVVRHAIAVERGTSDIPDDERPLTAKGRKRMQQIARGLYRLGIQPERILTSPLPRAFETAEIVAAALRIADRLEVCEVLRADSDPAAIRDGVLTRTEDRLMIVGHNPGLSQLLGLLLTGLANPWVCELKKGGVAALSTREEGGFAIDWITTPRLLRLLDEA